MEEKFVPFFKKCCSIFDVDKSATIVRKKMKRERSLTTKLTHKNIAAEVALKSRLTERRRSSQIRLAERIKDLKKDESNVEKVNDNKDDTKVSMEKDFSAIYEVVYT